MALKTKKFQPNQLVEAIQPCFITVPDDTPQGATTYSFNPGKQRVRASHPAVVSNPNAFQAIDDGASDTAA